jgi:hypothetical protein
MPRLSFFKAAAFARGLAQLCCLQGGRTLLNAPAFRVSCHFGASPDPPSPLPQAYVAQQTDACAELRIQACLRLRDQVSRLQALLLDAPSVGIADAASRLLSAARSDTASLMTQYTQETKCVGCVCLCTPRERVLGPF